jgi:hypothetical protein
MYGSSYTIASLGIDTGACCAEGQIRMRADRTSDESDGTTRLIMIANVDDCGDVAARVDV